MRDERLKFRGELFDPLVFFHRFHELVDFHQILQLADENFQDADEVNHNPSNEDVLARHNQHAQPHYIELDPIDAAEVFPLVFKGEPGSQDDRRERCHIATIFQDKSRLVKEGLQVGIDAHHVGRDQGAGPESDGQHSHITLAFSDRLG